MKRDYSTGKKSTPTLFVGKEVEHTPAYGNNTLFVVGVQDTNTLLAHAKEHDCNHIYLGANHSFDGNNKNLYARMITAIFKETIWCTLEMTHAVYLESIDWLKAWKDNHQFIPNIRIDLPHIAEMNYNATIKLGDVDFKATNSGVWCYRLNDLIHSDHFTGWNEYGQDHIIEEENNG